jgi:5,10-methylenetetrahydromethanopterin reductase
VLPSRHLALSADLSFQELVAVSQVAEERGFDAIWLTDVRFSRDCYAVLGALAVQTETLRLVSGVSDPYSRHPAQLASAVATIDEISDGRAVLGLGAGGSGLDKLGIEVVKPLSTLREAITCIRALTSGAASSARAPGFVLTEGKLTFPAQGAPPIAMAAHGPRMYELAGELADIVLVANYVDPSGIRWARQRLDAGMGRRAPGLAQPEVLWRVDVCISDDGEEARRFMSARVARLLQSGYYSASFLRPMGLEDIAGSATQASAVARVLDAVALAGRPQELATRAADGMSTGSFDGICCRLEVLPGQDVLGSLERLSDLLDLVTDRASTAR